MNRFIKRNILLVVFFTVALIGMLVMLVLTVWQYVDMKVATGETEALGKTIDSLSAQSPAPSKENIELITDDLEQYQERLDEVQLFFGQPLYPALEVAYRELGIYRQAEAFYIIDFLNALDVENGMEDEDDIVRAARESEAVAAAEAADLSAAEIGLNTEKILVRTAVDRAVEEMRLLLDEEIAAEDIETAVNRAFEQVYYADETFVEVQKKNLKNMLTAAVAQSGTVFADEAAVDAAVAEAMAAELSEADRETQLAELIARSEIAEDAIALLAGKNKSAKDFFRNAMDDFRDALTAESIVNDCKNLEYVKRVNAAFNEMTVISALRASEDRDVKEGVARALARAKRDVPAVRRAAAENVAVFRERFRIAVAGFLKADAAEVLVQYPDVAAAYKGITSNLVYALHAKAEQDFYNCFLTYWEAGKSEGDDNRTIFQDFKNSREAQRLAAERRAAAEAAEAALLEGELTEEEELALYEYEEEYEEEEEELEDDGYPYYWTVAQWNDAMKAFQAEAVKYTRLPVLNSEEVFFFALGVPRDFTGTDQAKKMVETLQRELQTYYEKNYIGLEDDAMYFGMPAAADLKLTHAQLGYVGNVIEIISDLGIRVAGPQRPQPGTPEAESGREKEHLITALSEFSRIDMEDEDDEYDIYRFRIKVYSNMAGVMGIINRLNSAVDERRFYMIRRMEMKSYIDEAHEIRYEANLDDEATMSIIPEDGVTGTSGMPGMSTPRPSSRTSGMPGVSASRPPSARTSARGSSSVSTPGIPGIGMSGIGSESSASVSRRRVRISELDAEQNINNGMGGYPGAVNDPYSMMGGQQQMTGYYNEFGQFVYVEEEREEDKPLAERAEYAKPVIGEFTELDVEFIIDYYILKNTDFETE